MKIVIDIPDFVYALAKKTNIIKANIEGLEKAIIEGKPLPEGHGRLIDADALEHIIGKFPLCWEYGQGVNDCWDALIAAPTIIEADAVPTDPDEYLKREV